MKRSVVAVVSVICWMGAIAIIVAGFLDGLGDPDEQIEWSRLSSVLVGLAVVLSIAWVFDRYVVSPRSAFQLGVEAGERRARRSAEFSSLLPFRKAASNGHHKTTAG